jgi:hypothetical protein
LTRNQPRVIPPFRGDTYADPLPHIPHTKRRPPMARRRVAVHSHRTPEGENKGKEARGEREGETWHRRGPTSAVHPNASAVPPLWPPAVACCTAAPCTTPRSNRRMINQNNAVRPLPLGWVLRTRSTGRGSAAAQDFCLFEHFDFRVRIRIENSTLAIWAASLRINTFGCIHGCRVRLIPAIQHPIVEIAARTTRTETGYGRQRNGVDSRAPG